MRRLLVAAEAEGAFAAVEGEVPVGDAVERHEVAGEGLGFGWGHGADTKAPR